MAVLHVACAADAAYVPHTAAMLHSVLARRGALDVFVHYLHGPGLPESCRRPLADMVRRGGGDIGFLSIPDEWVAGLPTLSIISAPMWYRVFLPELLEDVDRLLYLDADVIALDSLEPLWATPLEGHHVAAVTNVFRRRHMHRPLELGLAGVREYFNSGVLLMNLELMRRDRSSDALVELARTRGADLMWPDQDALNLVLGATRLPLHPRWNCMNSVYELPWAVDAFGPVALDEARARPAIRHFEGPGRGKPWHILSDVPLRGAYFAHRHRTPWPHARFDEDWPVNVARRLVRDAWRLVTT